MTNTTLEKEQNGEMTRTLLDNKQKGEILDDKREVEKCAAFIVMYKLLDCTKFKMKYK